ncbi:MAG: hypothetical protein WAU01_14545, partial [Saprospiraceae bacterium]
KRNCIKVKFWDTPVFSSILNTDSVIGDLLLNSDGQFEFYSASYLKEELENHIFESIPKSH